jgi:hypothetical protein
MENPSRPHGIEVAYSCGSEVFEPWDTVLRCDACPELQAAPLSGHGACELQHLFLRAAPSGEGDAQPASEPKPPGIHPSRGFEHSPALEGVIQASGLGRALETEAESPDD